MTQVTKSEPVQSQQLSQFETMIKTGMLPASIKTPEQALLIVKMGDELGFTPIQSLKGISVIQGTPALGVHLISSLAKRSGAEWTLTEDFITVTSVAKGSIKKGTPIDSLTAEEAATFSNAERDARTTFVFYTQLKDGKGNTLKVIEKPFSYNFSEAVLSGLTAKDNWKKMPKLMTRTRALTQGIRLYFPECLSHPSIGNIYEATEYAEMNGVAYETDAEGNVIDLK